MGGMRLVLANVRSLWAGNLVKQLVLALEYRVEVHSRDIRAGADDIDRLFIKADAVEQPRCCLDNFFTHARVGSHDAVDCDVEHARDFAEPSRGRLGDIGPSLRDGIAPPGFRQFRLREPDYQSAFKASHIR